MTKSMGYKSMPFSVVKPIHLHECKQIHDNDTFSFLRVGLLGCGAALPSDTPQSFRENCCKPWQLTL